MGSTATGQNKACSFVLHGVVPISPALPLNALEQGQNGSFIYVVQPNGMSVVRSVTVLETLDGRAVIEQGLQAGETVVVAGQYRLGADTKVVAALPGDPRVQNQTPASQGMLG